LYFGRFAVVHIGGPSSNQAASLESRPIHSIQLLFGKRKRRRRRGKRTRSRDPPRPDYENVRDSGELFRQYTLLNKSDADAVHDLIMATANHLQAMAGWI